MNIGLFKYYDQYQIFMGMLVTEQSMSRIQLSNAKIIITQLTKIRSWRNEVRGNVRFQMPFSFKVGSQELLFLFEHVFLNL